MTTNNWQEISIEPIIQYPKTAEPNKSYLMTVDVHPIIDLPGNWPYDGEEYVINCHVNCSQLFNVQSLGDTTIIVHRFGGTYGPVRFILTASNSAKSGFIHISLINGWGIPLSTIKLSSTIITNQNSEIINNVIGLATPDSMNSLSDARIKENNQDLSKQIKVPQLPSLHAVEPPLDNALQAMEGFYYLRKRDLVKAGEAFQKAGKGGMAKEMSDLCLQLQKLTASESWLERSKDFFKIENRPKKSKRVETWDALDDFKAMLDELWLYKRCSEISENRTLLRNQVYERLDRLASKRYSVEEGELLNAVANSWREPINRWFDKGEKPIKAKAIEPNPYKYIQPLDTGGALIGRKEQQERLLIFLERNQSILLYGQAGTGKSSLIFRLQKLAKGKLLQPIIIDLAALNLPHSTICQQVLKMIGQHLSKLSSVRAPDEQAANYMHRFHDFLDKACAVDPTHKISVVIERLELVINADIDDMHLLIVFLSNISVHIPNFKVIFVGRVLPKEVEEIAKNNSPIGLNPIKLSFLDEKGTKALLNSPLESVIARFRNDTVEHIFDLANGQPILLQILARNVIDRFNERQKDEKDFPDPVFSVTDIDTELGMFIKDNEFFFDPNYARVLPFWKMAEPFFKAFLEPLERRSSQHRQLLNEVAKEPDGFPEAAILSEIGPQMGITTERIQLILSELEILDLLKKDKYSHDWKIAIELLRIYILINEYN